ncbi:hypothetical protein HELRODRAFT_84162 [Helobdella robusta]|uniref:NADH dehydrogenase [ubiquinone] 1 alpha subcomplex subunit 8 n=1 Tax=Helobdella robusta TaxID=6412 RepID=T1G5F7_HELRO|nr:hypothetical protein HELRODRAFT_84162 [Helobdella robusta]ESN99574.1 hypothetical protein HELRODRAFT_84162 [Helobdella robusta]
MPFTNDDYLPTFEDLQVEELKLSSAPLRAGAHHFGKYCDNQCKEFMLCNEEEKDPRKCLNEGKNVTKCGLEFFNKVKDNCAVEFTKYWKCVDHSDHDMSFRHCRRLQSEFDKCIFDKLGQERPPLGYFSKIRVHNTTRPKPERKLNLPEKDPLYEIGPDLANPPPSIKTGSRII